MKERVLITGGTSGIGLELAKLFAADGHQIAIVGRSLEKTGQTCIFLRMANMTASIRWFIYDLTHGDLDGLFDFLEKQDYIPTVLVNCAGVAHRGDFTDSFMPNQIGTVELNVDAVLRLTKEFGRAMMRKGHGYILNVASLAAFAPSPQMAVYAATKAFLLSFSVALASELEGTGVSVTCLCPGGVSTGFHERAGAIREKRSMDAATVAKIGYDAMWARKRVVVPGRENYVKSILFRLVGPVASARIVRFFTERQNRKVGTP